MDALDYVEAQAQRLTAFRLETMELLNKRAHTLATLQLGGGGALAAFGVALLDKPRLHWAAVGVLVAAALWFVLAPGRPTTAWSAKSCTRPAMSRKRCCSTPMTCRRCAAPSCSACKTARCFGANATRRWASRWTKPIWPPPSRHCLHAQRLWRYFGLLAALWCRHRLALWNRGIGVGDVHGGPGKRVDQEPEGSAKRSPLGNWYNSASPLTFRSRFLARHAPARQWHPACAVGQRHVLPGSALRSAPGRPVRTATRPHPPGPAAH